MGMSTHVVGFKPPDETWHTMKAIWDTCTAAGILPPREVEDFFEGAAPDPAGVEVVIPVREWKNDYEAGYEIDVDSIPEHVSTIRFYNSW